MLRLHFRTFAVLNFVLNSWSSVKARSGAGVPEQAWRHFTLTKTLLIFFPAAPESENTAQPGVVGFNAYLK